MTIRFRGFGLQGGSIRLFLVSFLITAVGIALAFGGGFRSAEPLLFGALLLVQFGLLLALLSGAWGAYRILRRSVGSDATHAPQSWTTVLLPVCFLIMLTGSHILATRPELYRTCTSSVDGLMLKVYRATSPPYIEGVDVIVTVETPNGRRLYRRVIDNRDLWTDVEQRYPNVLCESDRFIVGPQWFDGTRFTDFVIAKSDLAAKD